MEYRKGGPLALTDANLMLGRLIPDYFPKVFGKSEKEPLDFEASRMLFEKVTKEINASHEKKFSIDEIVYGWVWFSSPSISFLTYATIRFIKVANETMCRPIRALTEGRGYATGKHVYAREAGYNSSLFSFVRWIRLASFGGAGGQHACEIASSLGIKTVLIHRYSSILSAYGLALADRYVHGLWVLYRQFTFLYDSAYELQEPSSTLYTPQDRSGLLARLDKMTVEVRTELQKQGFEDKRIHIERMLNMRFEGMFQPCSALVHTWCVGCPRNGYCTHGVTTRGRWGWQWRLWSRFQ